ncbi:hypothetical protein T492DRAFT_996830 [Pavlovales sp. CCMP2436]|nr:hypothetical protein T492DRAFT_996830 [Pavlovales sp. CCMP2436]
MPSKLVVLSLAPPAQANSEPGTIGKSGFILGDADASCDTTCTAAGGMCGEESLEKMGTFTATSMSAAMADIGVVCAETDADSGYDEGEQWWSPIVFVADWGADLAYCYFLPDGEPPSCSVASGDDYQRMCWCQGQTADPAEPAEPAETEHGAFFVSDVGASCDTTCVAAGGTCGDESLEKMDARLPQRLTHSGGGEQTRTLSRTPAAWSR